MRHGSRHGRKASRRTWQCNEAADPAASGSLRRWRAGDRRNTGAPADTRFDAGVPPPRPGGRGIGGSGTQRTRRALSAELQRHQRDARLRQGELLRRCGCRGPAPPQRQRGLVFLIPRNHKTGSMEGSMSAIETNDAASIAGATAASAPPVGLRPIAAARAFARRADRVVLAFVILIAFVAAVDPSLAPRLVVHMAAQLAHLVPWFVLSVLFAAAAKASGGDTLIAQAFVGREGRVIPIAAMVGGLTPFCSCGVIPLVAGLFAAGVPLAPVMALWIASPLMDPTQFFVNAGSIGLSFAIAKTMAAVGMGLLGGYRTMLLVRAGLVDTQQSLRPGVEPQRVCSSS